MSVKKSVFLVLVLLIAAFASGCAGHASPRPDTREVELPAAAPVAEKGTNTTGEEENGGNLTERKIIVEVDMEMVVMEIPEAEGKIEGITTKYGGYVAAASISGTGEEKRGEMTLRIPADKLDEALKEISGEAKEVKYYNRRTKDVTARYVDYKARLENLEATEKELRAMLDEVRKRPNASAKDILDVYNQLVKIRGEIDSVKGQLQVLEKLVNYSTVHLTLTQSVKTLPESKWNPGSTARKAVHALVSSLRWFADAFIWTLIYVLPVLLILAIPVALVVYFARWLLRKARRRPKKGTE